METMPVKQISLDGMSITIPVLSILMVEDNIGDVFLVTELIKESGINFTLTHASDLKETYTQCADKEFDVILLDLGLPGSTGLDTLKIVHEYIFNSPIVVLTGLDDEDIALASLREGAQDYLVKNSLTSDNILRSIKYGIERKKIQHLLIRHTNQFSILSSATGSITRCEGRSLIYKITCTNIRLLLENANAITIEWDNPATVSVSCTEWLEPWFEKIKTITGIDMNNPLFKVSDQKKELVDLFQDGKLREIKGGLYDIFAGNVEMTYCSELEKILGFNKYYAIGFLKGHISYGGVIIFSQQLIGNDDINIIETIGSHASLSIHRKTIENELRLSDYRFRKLSKGLEQKVIERTKDLQTANILLNKELIERNLAQEALKKSEAQLKDLNVTKDKFFNIVAHDLKNPFTCLIGASELLFASIQQLDTEKTKVLAKILNDSARHGYTILLNLLDWSRSQTGLLRFNPEKINLSKLLNENIANIQMLATNKEIKIYSEADENIYIFADNCMIQSVLRNLLGNAIKFTRRSGKIVVNATIDSENATISVKDTGIGISKENIEKLFRIDTKYSMPGTDNEQGTGLGLKLCKEFVEKQSGKIWVNSIENQGSEFIFSIPLNND